MSLECHGRISGLAASPDGAHLYVSLHPWPAGYAFVARAEGEQPPVAAEAACAVVNLAAGQVVGVLRNRVRGFTANRLIREGGQGSGFCSWGKLSLRSDSLAEQQD